MKELQQASLLGDLVKMPGDLTEMAAQVTGVAGNLSSTDVALAQVAWKRGVGKLKTELGFAPDRKATVPFDLTLIALQRGIPNHETSYIKASDGRVTYVDGSPILSRNNTLRIDRERKGVAAYLMNQGPQENTFIYEVLSDPNSDTIDDRYRGGVMRVNTRRFQPMALECRAAVVIPARFEASRIEHTLEGFANQQGVNPNQYEINVIVNHRHDEIPDETTEVVLAFMRKYPELRVNLIDLQFDRNHANVGYARKLMTDTTLVRAVKRAGYYSPLYIITADADETKVDPTIVKKTIDGFDSDPTVDCLRGRQDRSNALIAQNDLTALIYKSNQIAEYILRDRKLRDPYRPGFHFDWNRVVSGGWASAFTAESYAITSGYIPLTLGEDVAVGQLCSLARGHWDESGNLVPYIDVTKTMPVKGESNFLRMGEEIITGLSAYREDQFTRQDIKKMSELDILRALAKWARVNPANSENISRFVNAVRSPFYFVRGNVDDDAEFMRFYGPRFLTFVGFKSGDYEIVRNNGDVQLVIKNWSNIQALLEANR